MEIIAPKFNVVGSSRSSITLCWGNEDETEFESREDEESRTQYILQIKDRIRGWITVYW